MKSSGIGGQAVMEGVMMRNGDEYAVAVRKPDKEIAVKISEHRKLGDRYPVLALPIIRGVVSFGESMVIGIKTLTYSASFFEDEETQEPEKKKSKSDEKKDEKNKETKEKLAMAGTVALSVVLAIAIFMMLPYFLSRLLSGVIESGVVLALLEGVIRVALFVGYVAAISQLKDIRRVFMYHGAEHKVINCIENGCDLTVDNVKKQTRVHKRCGTSFMLVVMCVSILFFIIIRVDTAWLRVLLRLLLIPVIAGVSYEFIRLAGKSDNPVVNFFSKPGLWLQGLTTREPDEEMIEVAIASVEAVYEWKPFVEQVRKEKEKLKSRSAIESSTEAAADIEIENDARHITSHVIEKIAEGIEQESEFIRSEDDAEDNVRKSEIKRQARFVINEHNIRSAEIGLTSDEDEDDEILKALDKFFVAKNKEDEK